MRACAQCGLSVAQTATFCPVCGATAEMLGSPPPAAVDPDPAPLDANPGTADVDIPAVPEPPQDGNGARDLHEVALVLRDAAANEKPDPGQAARLYRAAILSCLEVTDDPLDREDVRRSLLRSFDRLSLVLKREGLPAEALEEVESAASLGLLDCTDRGVKGHREALKKRRVSLRRAADLGSSVR